MTKELEALERLYCAGRLDLDYVLNGKQNQDYKIVETALKRLEEHDKLFKKYKIDDNWLEACLYVIKNNFPMNTKTKLNKFKAFEIIKRKGVAVGFIQLLTKENCGGVRKYNDYIGNKKLYLTQEEYELLKDELL